MTTKEESKDPNWMGDESEEDEIYKENILDHFKNPHNFGELKDYTVKSKELNPLCGDSIEIFIKIDNDRIQDVKFKGSGCAISIAATSMITDLIKGKSISEIKSMSNEDILNMLGINLGIVRIKCGNLCLKTILNGIKQIETQKNG